jgi:hypothetical protein
MKDRIEDIQEIWQDARKSMPKSGEDQGAALLREAKLRQQKSLYIHFGNIVVMLLSLGAVVYFFSFFLGMQSALSKWGLGLMYGGLAIRIVIEIYSSFRYRQIDMSDPALVNTRKNLRFYQFRKQVHGPLTLSIVGLYTLGFYMLTPEFYRHMDLLWLILIDLSFIPAAIIPFWQARRGIRQEMRELDEIIAIRQKLS